MASHVDRPIVIVGTGRCGSTMLHRLLARHPQLGWTSTFNEVFPTQAWLSVFSNLYNSRMLNDRIKHWTCFPKPFEAYRFWEHFLPGFSRRDKPLEASDVPGEGVEPLRRTVASLLRFQGRERFLIKVTGWSRIAYFDRIFPDARFIFLQREPRAVLSSWVQAGWLDVTSAVDSPRWQWGAVPAPYRETWKELGGGPLLSAAVKIQLDLDDIRRNIRQFPERTLELDYDALIAQPLQVLRSITDFSALRWDSNFEASMREMKFFDTRTKWMKYLSAEQGDLVLEFFRRIDSQARPAPICLV